MQVVAPGIAVVSVRSPTLPPATHTNTYVVGRSALTVVDPASPYDDEQSRLHALLSDTQTPVERILLTHHHPDHVSGVAGLQQAFPGTPVWAHDRTAQRLRGLIHVDHLVADDDVLDCGGVTLNAVFTPGHAPGHLVFYDPASHALIAGDMVAGVGTILIDQADGDLGLYLASLQRMRALKPGSLLPSHGPVLEQADAVLAFYIAHRHQRSDQVRQALDEHGALTPDELVPLVYADLDPRAAPIAAVQLTSHLLWLAQHGRVVAQGARYRSA